MRRVRRPSQARPRRSFDTWQIIYIDLMTNVMIFFVVLWAIQTHQTARATGQGRGLGNESVKMIDLPGDVLFAPGKSELSEGGHQVLGRLFGGGGRAVLDFDAGALHKRLLVIHGHTDSDGAKEKNLELGYARALSAYHEIARYGADLSDHVVLCTHADNTAAARAPAQAAELDEDQQAALRRAKAKNRRITIEDKLVGVAPAAELAR
jgi:flagellar motor protein MotB